MGIAAQYLMQFTHFNVIDLVSVRLALAGILLLAFLRLTGQSIVKSVIEKHCWLGVVIYGLGMLGIQLTFFLSINASNAATAALMVTTGPLFVTGWTAFAEHRAITRQEWLCIGLAILGVGLIVTKGRLDSIDFSVAGCFWGIVSAACGSFCTIQGKSLMDRIPVGVVVGWGMAIGGAVLCLAVPPELGSVAWTLSTVSLCFYIAAFGTVGAFCCYLASMRYIPAPVTSLLAVFEPFSAVVLGVILMGLTLNAAEYCGIAVIFLMVFVLSRRP